jgi:DNA-binding response OmpR family regulator
MPTNKTVMVVEDEDHIAYLLNFLLQKDGYIVNHANDGEKAMSIIDSETPPQLVILDMLLPFYDGNQLLKHLRAKPAWKDVPVLMLTAKSREQDITRALENGATDYMVKPFQPLELRERINRLVRHSSRQPSPTK